LPVHKEGKKRLDCYVNGKALQRLREIAVIKTGTTRGLSYAVEKAIIEYISRFDARARGAQIAKTSAFTISIDGAPSTVDKKYAEVVHYIAKTYGIDFDALWWSRDGQARVLRQYFEEAMEVRVATQKRFRSKWEERFRRFKLVADDGEFGGRWIIMRRPDYIETELSEQEKKELAAESENGRK
jgi:hypothetical protein